MVTITIAYTHIYLMSVCWEILGDIEYNIIWTGQVFTLPNYTLNKELFCLISKMFSDLNIISIQPSKVRLINNFHWFFMEANLMNNLVSVYTLTCKWTSTIIVTKNFWKALCTLESWRSLKESLMIYNRKALVTLLNTPWERPDSRGQVSSQFVSMSSLSI